MENAIMYLELKTEILSDVVNLSINKSVQRKTNQKPMSHLAKHNAQWD